MREEGISGDRYDKDTISTLTYFKGSPTTRHPEMVD